MNTRYFALILGIVYVLVGILGFIPGITQATPADALPLTINNSYGYLFGLFPVNLLHNLVHLVLGVWGIIAYGRYTNARLYARALTIIFAILAIMGLIPGLNTIFGLVPLFSHDIWLHALTALVSAYFGFVAPAEVTTSTSRPI